MAIRFGNGFGIGASNNGGTSLNFFTNIEAITSYLKGYMSDFRNPDFYEYSLDGDGHYVYDGGNDMMDNSNFTTPWLISNASYSGDSGNTSDYPYSVDYNANGVGTIDNSFGFISLGYNNPTYLPLTVIGTRATIANPGTPIGFQCGGNIGADGQGTFVEGNIYTGDTVSGFTVHSYYRETYNAYDPSVCDVFILLGHPDWNSVFGDVYHAGESDNQGSGSYLYTSGGGCQNILAIKTLLSKANGVEVTFSEIQTVVDNFILRIKEAKENLTPTPTPTPTPSTSYMPLSQFTPNGTTGSNGLLTYLNYTNGLDPNNAVLLPDSSGFNHPYAWTGTNPYSVGTTGYTFVGGSTFAYASDASNYNLGFNSLTIEMWVKIPSIPGTMSLLAAGGNQSGGWALRVDGAGLQLNLVKYNVADQTVNLPSRLQADTWYHIVAAQGGTSLSYFVNGELVGAVNNAVTDNFHFPNGTVNIGKDYYANTNTALTLGILKVYDYCLLTADVLNEFDSTKTDYGFPASSPTPTPTPTATPAPNWPTGLSARYSANSYTGGSVLSDLSGNGFDMSLTNPVFVTSGANKYFTSNSSTYYSIPGNSTIYSTDFTWSVALDITSAPNNDWGSIFWSEIGGKNFIIGYYGAWWNGSPAFAPRIDTPSFSHQSWNNNEGYTNAGQSPSTCIANYSTTTPLSVLTVRKNGTTFEWFLNNDVIWTNTISDWSIPNINNSISLLNRAQANYASNANFTDVVMFGRAIDNTELATVVSIIAKNI